jgi:hypothetical protein
VKLALSIAALLLLLVLTGGSLVLVHDVHQLLGQSTRTIAAVDTSAGRLNVVLSTAQAAAQGIKDSEAKQLESLAQTERQTAGTVRALRLFLDRTDRSLNDTLVPHLDLAIARFSQDSSGSLDSLTRAGDSFSLSAAALGRASNDLDAQLKDPQIAELVGRLDMTTLHIEGISANAEAMSGDMKLAVHRLAQPPSKVHQALDVAWTAAKFGSLFVP